MLFLNPQALEAQQQDLVLHLEKLQDSVRSEGAERLPSEDVVSALGTLTKQSVRYLPAHHHTLTFTDVTNHLSPTFDFQFKTFNR